MRIIRATGAKWLPEIVMAMREYHSEADCPLSELSFDTDVCEQVLWDSPLNPEVRDNFILLAVEGEILLGVYWGCYGRPVFSHELYGHDIGFYVYPFYRKLGVGNALLLAAEKVYRDAGCRVAQGGTNSGSTLGQAASRLYSDSGYVPIGSNFQRPLG